MNDMLLDADLDLKAFLPKNERKKAAVNAYKKENVRYTHTTLPDCTATYGLHFDLQCCLCNERMNHDAFSPLGVQKLDWMF